jgi:hypothetical protein
VPNLEMECFRKILEEMEKIKETEEETMINELCQALAEDEYLFPSSLII